MVRIDDKIVARIQKLSAEDARVHPKLTMNNFMLAEDTDFLVQTQEYGAHYLTTGFQSHNSFISLVSVNRTSGNIMWKYDIQHEKKIRQLSVNNTVILETASGRLPAIRVGGNGVIW